METTNKEDKSKKETSESLSHDHFKAEGDEHTKARRFEKAEVSYTHAISLEYTQHATWGNRSLVRLKLGNIKGAAKDALMCTELSPGWPKGWARLGAAERARNNITASYEAYRRAHELDPSNKEFERLLQEVLDIKENSQSDNHSHKSHQHDADSSFTNGSSTASNKAATTTREGSNSSGNRASGSTAPAALFQSSVENITNSLFKTSSPSNKIEPYNRSNYHMQMKPMPRVIPLRVLESLSVSRNKTLSLVWQAIDSFVKSTGSSDSGGGGGGASSGAKSNSNKHSKRKDKKKNNKSKVNSSEQPLVENIDCPRCSGIITSQEFVNVVQSLMSTCLEKLPRKPVENLSRDQQMSIFLIASFVARNHGTDLHNLVAFYMLESHNLLREARKIVATLPVVHELWCCCCSLTLDDTDITPIIPIANSAFCALPLNEVDPSLSKEDQEMYSSFILSKPTEFCSISVAVLSGVHEGAVVGVEHNVPVDQAQSIVHVLCSMMAYPSSPCSTPRRPIGILLSSSFIKHYAIIAKEMLELDIACRLESETESENQRLEYENQQQALHNQHHHQHYHQHHPSSHSKRACSPSSSLPISSMTSSTDSSVKITQPVSRAKSKTKSKRPDKPKL